MEGATSWIAIAALAITAFREVMTRRNDRQTARDKLEFDAKLVSTQAELATVKVSQERCAADHAESKAATERCEKKHEKTEKELGACKEKHEETDKRLTALEVAKAIGDATKKN